MLKVRFINCMWRYKYDECVKLLTGGADFRNQQLAADEIVVIRSVYYATLWTLLND